MIKTRFAPSPTGFLHLGNLRVAIINYLFALAHQGSFMLRIEDTDQKRNNDEFIAQIKNDLKWIGIEYQKPVIYQSKRKAIYDIYFNQLKDLGYIYPCFCSKSRLEQLKQAQMDQKIPPSYDGHCKNLNQKQIDSYKQQDIKPVYRFCLTQKEIFLNDLRYGKTQKLTHFGDFVIKRSDGAYIFLLTNVVDDIDQQISHAIRGEDHLSNSLLQTAICEALGKKAPIYLHLNLITNLQGKPLSKRDSVFSLYDLKASSYHKLAIINYLVRLGSSLNSKEVFNLNTLARLYDIQSMAKTSSKFDIEQLNYWQKKTIQTLSLEQFKDWLNENNQDIVYLDNNPKISAIIQESICFANELKPLMALFNSKDNIFLKIKEQDQEKIEIIKNTPEQLFKFLKQALIDGWDFDQLLNYLKSKIDLENKKLFQALRIVISYQLQGPKIRDLYQCIDKDLQIKRVENCLQFKKEQTNK